MAAELLCAIHQPSFFPRLSTQAKLFTADMWVVLDDVQFTRRDYQHCCRLAALNDPAAQQWLTVPVHLPDGRSTRIKDVRIARPVPGGEFWAPTLLLPRDEEYLPLSAYCFCLGNGVTNLVEGIFPPGRGL